MTGTTTRPPPASTRRQSSVAVLLVEDETLAALAMRDDLEELGCQVVGWAMSASDAERLAATTPPDIIVMDVRLKGQPDGVEAAIRLRERTRAPIIFVTGGVDVDTRERMRKVAPAAIVNKPLTQQDLAGALALACAEAGLPEPFALKGRPRPR